MFVVSAHVEVRLMSVAAHVKLFISSLQLQGFIYCIFDLYVTGGALHDFKGCRSNSRHSSEIHEMLGIITTCN